MKEQVKQKSAIRELITVVFGNSTNYDSEDEKIEDKAFLSTWKSIDEKGKQIEQPIVEENSSSNKGGFSQGLAKFDNVLKQMKQNQEKAKNSIKEENKEENNQEIEEDIIEK